MFNIFRKFKWFIIKFIRNWNCGITSSKKEYSRIALLTSIIVASSFFFITELTTGFQHLLTYMFIVLAFFFIHKTTRNYILFGIFAALGTLTHQLASPVLFSYLAFLLFKREFKGFLIVLSVWFSVLSPWMIRQYKEFNDFGL